jgi:hypothetical protein
MKNTTTAGLTSQGYESLVKPNFSVTTHMWNFSVKVKILMMFGLFLEFQEKLSPIN